MIDCTRSVVVSYQGKVFEVSFEFSADDAAFRISAPNADDHFHLCSIPNLLTLVYAWLYPAFCISYLDIECPLSHFMDAPSSLIFTLTYATVSATATGSHFRRGSRVKACA